jgi:tetratricopeptide (TPR) repeat protein
MTSSSDDLVEREKRVAKTLHRILKDELALDDITLAECQTTTAEFFGFKGWYDLRRHSSKDMHQADETLDADSYRRRLENQIKALNSLTLLEDELAKGVLTALRPTAKGHPRTLAAAAADGALAATRAEDGILGTMMVGPAAEIADRAHELISMGDYSAAAQTAQTALNIDPDCVDALEALGLCGTDPIRSLEFHARSSAAAWKIYGPAWQRWAEQNPREKPVFWQFMGSRPFLRANMNYGRRLMIAAKERYLPRHRAYKQAIAVFTKLLRVHAAPEAARERRMIAAMAIDDWRAAGKDARVLQRRKRSCYSAWTLAWTAQREGGPNLASAVDDAITVCPFVLPLLLDRLGGQPPKSRDDDGPLMASSFVYEVEDCWRSSADLQALALWRPQAENAIRKAKLAFASNWGALLPAERRRPVPEHWRL